MKPNAFLYVVAVSWVVTSLVGCTAQLKTAVVAGGARNGSTSAGSAEDVELVASDATSMTIGWGFSSHKADRKYLLVVSEGANGHTDCVDGVAIEPSKQDEKMIYKIEGLKENTAYSVKLCSVDAGVVSVLGQPTQAKAIKTKIKSPLEATGFKVESADTTSMTVAWTHDGTKSSGKVLAWRVGTVAPESCESDHVIASKDIGVKSSWTFKDLTQGMTLSMRLCMLSMEEPAKHTNGVTLRARTRSETPSNATNLTVTRTSATQLTVNWTGGTTKNGGYRVAMVNLYEAAMPADGRRG